MHQETAEVIAIIGKCIKEEWPKCSLTYRPTAVYMAVSNQSSANIFSTVSADEFRCNLGDHKELIILTSSGSLGVYDLHGDTEPMRVELIEQKTVLITKSYTVMVPLVGMETDSDIRKLVLGHERLSETCNITVLE